jgi:hypothetical protein
MAVMADLVKCILETDANRGWGDEEWMEIESLKVWEMMG